MMIPIRRSAIARLPSTQLTALPWPRRARLTSTRPRRTPGASGFSQVIEMTGIL
jgi:hypothetical protein